MTHPLVKDHLAAIATHVFGACRLLGNIESLEAPEEVKAQLRLLHIGLDLAYSAIENPAIDELIKGDDRPF